MTMPRPEHFSLRQSFLRILIKIMWQL